ncbi:MAG: hypothetical protein NTW16_04120, partial [Bacteroidetes bacterium]|nr:hypothetical protein [Bacteroidota bacterium]
MKSCSHLYGIPVLTHLNIAFVQEFYRFLFLSGLYTTEDADKVIRIVFEKRKNEEDLADLKKSAGDSLLPDMNEHKRSVDEIDRCKNKITAWIKCFPDTTDDELGEYFSFHAV